jgi:hypothetical protein
MLSCDASPAEPMYRSRFHDWDARSAVRAKPLPNCTARETASSLYFTPELVPAANHPLVLARGEEAVRQLLVFHLLGHLEFTDILENEVVTPVAYMIARRQVGLAIPATMLVDARRIVVDETHHALMAASLIQDIAATSGVPALPAGRPSFLVELEEIKAAHDRDLAPLLMLFFAIVSETLITRTLTRIPDDERVVTGVRTFLKDHLDDEARHHVFFSDLLARCWPQLKPSQRAVVGPLLPRFITMFLRPDPAEVGTWLRLLGLPQCMVGRVVDEAYSSVRTASVIRSNAQSTLRQMRRAGVFEDARTADAFGNAGLV